MMLVSACPAEQAETSISSGYQLSMTRVRIVPVMASSASMVTYEPQKSFNSSSLLTVAHSSDCYDGAVSSAKR